MSEQRILGHMTFFWAPTRLNRTSIASEQQNPNQQFAFIPNNSGITRMGKDAYDSLEWTSSVFFVGFPGPRSQDHKDTFSVLFSQK